MAFFVEFFGGPPLYSERYGQPFLRFRHRKVKIGQPERDAWMALLMASNLINRVRSRARVVRIRTVRKRSCLLGP